MALSQINIRRPVDGGTPGHRMLATACSPPHIAAFSDYTTGRPVGYAAGMGEIDRLVPSGIIEQWVYHLRRQRSRAADTIWLIDQGFTMHDGKDGVPTHDATARYRQEQQIVIDEVTDLLKLYDGINLGKDVPVADEATH